MKVRAAVAALLACVLVGGGVTVVESGSSAPPSATGSVHPAGWGSTPKGMVLPRSLVGGVAQTFEQYDAVTVGNIPSNPFAVAGYTSGLYLTWPVLLRDFPRAHHVSIAISVLHHADCLDDEPGDASPSQAGAWVLADIKAGFARPCVYGDLSNMPAIQASIRAALGANWRTHVFLWLAWYRFVPGLVAGYDAVQWTDKALGRGLDESTVTPAFLSIAQPPYVAPRPLPTCIHRRESASVCAAAKAKIASQQRAAASSQRALNATNAVLAANRCVKPYRRGVCVHKGRDATVFSQRVRWFTAAAARLEAAN